MKEKKLSKSETEQEIKKIFQSNPAPKQIKKAKKLAMSKNIKLGKFRKLFCKKCLALFNPSNSEIRIKKPLKIIKCNRCGYISRYKLKN